MRKLFFIAALFMLVCNVVNAQTTKEEMKASEKRIETLQKFIKKAPAETSIGGVDAFTKAVYNTAVSAVANSEQLSSFYYRSIGETKDGVTDVTIKKPSLEDCVALSTTIAAEVVSAKDAAELAKAAAEGVKSERNPMKAAKVAKAVKTASDALPILTQESALQAKAIADIINTIKTSNNL